MTISKKLYLNFAAILALVILLLIVNLTALQREHATRAATARAIEIAQQGETVRYQMMQNRLALQNYLLSGDARDQDKMNDGITRLHAMIRDLSGKAADQQRVALTRLDESERQWENNFAKPLASRRKQVDTGNTTVADLQIYYLQLNPNSWMAASTSYLDEGEAAAATATLAVSIVSALIAIVLGMFISYKTSRSITEPLEQLIGMTREIGDSGDLAHEIDSKRKDEIGELARTFSKMIAYLKQMAAVSESIAGGDLMVEVKPLSPRDTLGNGFTKMVEGLRALVSSVRDSAAQVASGSSQVAGASDESAKISVQAASAIDEVTSTMHEISVNVQNVVKNTQVQ